MPGKSHDQQESGREYGLTPIPQDIHCAATPVPNVEENEQDQIDIEHFLDTLAQVALAIASRKLAERQAEGEG